MDFFMMKSSNARHFVADVLNKIRDTLSHRMARDTGLLALSQYVSAGLDFLTVVVATRWLGPSDYGLTALIMAYPTLLWSFVGVKSVSLTTRYIASFRDLRRSEDLVGMCKLGYSLDVIAATGAFL